MSSVRLTMYASRKQLSSVDVTQHILDLIQKYME